jgi:hypothetical protein
MNIQEPLVERRFLPICVHCKQIRTNTGQWQRIEGYLLAHFGLEFTHTLCPTHLEEEVGEQPNERCEDLVYEKIIKAFETLKAEHDALANWVKDFAEAAGDRQGNQNGYRSE